MLKYILLATTMTIAVPALAQEVKPADSAATSPTATPDTAVPVQDSQPVPQAEPQAAPVQPSPNPAPATESAQTTPEATPAEGQPAQTAQQPDPAAQPAATAAAEPAKQAPATSETQVADVVSKEFGSYDKDGNGALDQAEFGAWMTALRTASEPSFKGDTPAATKWVGQAFAQADTDKSKSVNQGELTKFLTPKTAS